MFTNSSPRLKCSAITRRRIMPPPLLQGYYKGITSTLCLFHILENLSVALLDLMITGRLSISSPKRLFSWQQFFMLLIAAITSKKK
ncbi:unnamed protein product, partial [Staurois parvus]